MTPLEAAQSQVGIREFSGKNDGVPAERFMGGDKLPWCAGFVLWCFEQAGAPIHKSNAQKYAFRLVKNLAEHGKAHLLEVSDPAPGDVIILKNRGSSDSGAGMHCGIVEWATGGLVGSIEGNWGNAVRRVKRARGSDAIDCYLRFTA